MAQVWWLIAILGSLVLFAVQNWSPSLSLNFLGRQSQSLPLAVWVLMAVAGGMVTYLMVNWLFQHSDRPIDQFNDEPEDFDQPLGGDRRSIHDAKTQDSEDWLDDRDQSRQTPEPPLDGFGKSSVDERTPTMDRSSADDYFEDEESEEEDEFFDDRDIPSQNVNPSDRGRKSSEKKPSDRSYERLREPKTSTQKGSVYSYSYRDASRSGVGRSEAVYDAEFRVLIPPPTPEMVETAEGWRDGAIDGQGNSRSEVDEDLEDWEEEDSPDWDTEAEEETDDWEFDDRRRIDDWEFEDDRPA